MAAAPSGGVRTGPTRNDRSADLAARVLPKPIGLVSNLDRPAHVRTVAPRTSTARQIAHGAQDGHTRPPAVSTREFLRLWRDCERSQTGVSSRQRPGTTL